MKLKVKVTKEHIAKGKRMNDTSCPVALAIKDVMPEGVKGVSVLNNNTYFYGKTDSPKFRAINPMKVSNFIWAFDTSWHKFITPFKFELELEHVKVYITTI